MNYKRPALLILLLLSLFMTGCTSLFKEDKPITIKEKPAKPIVVGAEAPVVEQKSLMDIYYGTNRQPNDMLDASKGYSNDRANKLYTGSCKVLVPKGHEIGKIKGSWTQKILHLDPSYGDIKVKNIARYNSEDALWSHLQSLFSNSKEKEALIFIHGYKNSFESAAIRTAQLGFDLGINGVTAFYSWPSANKLIGYSSDEATIQASEKYIKQFIRGFAKKSGAKKVHIIAHSMGNRGLLRAVSDIQKESPEVRFGQIILAAPDVDADLFKNIAKAYPMLSDKTTLYVSPKDFAVWTSKIKHNYPRIGVVTPVNVVDKIDTIQVNFDFSLLGLLGHTYFAQEGVILNDMYSLINESRKPSNKSYLVPSFNKENKKFWQMELSKK